MTETAPSLPYANARNSNEDFIKSIKDKYSTLGKPATASKATPPLRPSASVIPQKTLSKGPSQSRLDSSYLKDYQTLRRKYEERERAVSDEPQPTTNKSSPIKHFYDSSTPAPNCNYLSTRRQQIEQAHQHRANQHRLQREKNRRAIADIDQLLASIRGTFSGYKYTSL